MSVPSGSRWWASSSARICLIRSMANSTNVTGLTGDRRTVAEFTHQAFRGMGQRLQTRQTEKTTRAFDGMDEAEHVAENLGVVRLLLKTNELDVDHVEALVGFDQKFLGAGRPSPSSLRSGNAGPPDQFHPSVRSVALRRLISIAERDRFWTPLTAQLTRRVKIPLTSTVCLPRRKTARPAAFEKEGRSTWR